MALLKCGSDIFQYRSIQAIIEYKWEIAEPVIIKWLCMPFLGYLIVFQAYLEILFN